VLGGCTGGVIDLGRSLRVTEYSGSEDYAEEGIERHNHGGFCESFPGGHQASEKSAH
jgi:hypothetical protein